MARVENQNHPPSKQLHQTFRIKSENGSRRLVQKEGCEQQVLDEVSHPCGACVILGVGGRPSGSCTGCMNGRLSLESARSLLLMYEQGWLRRIRGNSKTTIAQRSHKGKQG